MCNPMHCTHSQVCCHFQEVKPALSTSSLLLHDAVAQLLAAKSKAGRRPDTIRNLRFYLGKFSAAHPGLKVAGITLEVVSDWLDKEVSSCSRSTGLSRLSALCSYCVRRGWLESNPCARVERIQLDAKPPRILTVEQCKRLLQSADAKVRTWIVLGLFAGLRPSEAQKTAWESIRLDGERPHVVVDSSASKVRRRRIVPLKPAAVAWLALDKREAGPVVSSYTSVRKFRRRAAKIAGMEWTQDVLRHTNASMRIAAGDHVHAVAGELGNSPAILQRHYVELVTREVATAFWSLLPSGSTPAQPPIQGTSTPAGG